MFVAENPVLHTFELGPAVTSLRSLDVAANPSLTQVRGMSGLARVTGGVRFARNDALTAIDLPSLAEVDTLTIEDDAALAQIDLPALRTIARTMTLSRVGRLESLAGFAGLRRMRRIAVSNHQLLLLAALVAACEPADAAQSAGYVDLVFEWDVGEPCIGSVGHLDRFVERMFEFLGEEPGDFQLPVHYATSASCKQDDELGCYAPSERRAYVFDEAGLRPLAVARHELTHAVAYRLWGSSAPFFEEGLAEALTRKEGVNFAWNPRVAPVANALAGSEVDDENAATFTRYLVGRGGLAAFRRVYQAARGKSQAELVALVEAVYGVPFAELEADYLAGPSECTFQLDLCDAEAAVAVDLTAPWSHDIVASCLSPKFYGVQSMATQIHVDVKAAGRARLRIAHDGQGTPHVELMRCGDCGVQSVLRARDGQELDLEPGLYTFEVYGGAATRLGLEP